MCSCSARVGSSAHDEGESTTNGWTVLGKTWPKRGERARGNYPRRGSRARERDVSAPAENAPGICLSRTVRGTTRKHGSFLISRSGERLLAARYECARRERSQPARDPPNLPRLKPRGEPDGIDRGVWALRGFLGARSETVPLGSWNRKLGARTRRAQATRALP